MHKLIQVILLRSFTGPFLLHSEGSVHSRAAPDTVTSCCKQPFLQEDKQAPAFASGSCSFGLLGHYQVTCLQHCSVSVLLPY